MDREIGLATLREALERLTAGIGQETASDIWPILQINFDRGRVSRWQRETRRLLDDYILLVAANYKQNCGYLRKIQQERDEKAWADLFTDLKKWAYRHLLQKNFTANRETYELAQAYATETAIVLLDSHFPYDLAFTPWMVTLLQRTCNRHMRRAVAQKRNPDGGTVSLANANEFLQNLAATDVAKQQEAWLHIMDAIERLPNPLWQEVLLLRYVGGLSPAEIAKQINKSPSAIYSIQFRAIAELKKVL